MTLLGVGGTVLGWWVDGINEGGWHYSGQVSGLMAGCLSSGLTDFSRVCWYWKMMALASRSEQWQCLPWTVTGQQCWEGAVGYLVLRPLKGRRGERGPGGSSDRDEVAGSNPCVVNEEAGGGRQGQPALGGAAQPPPLKECKHKEILKQLHPGGVTSEWVT